MISLGDRLGEYEIVAELSRGGMATVFLARHAGREVALKVIHPRLSRDPRFVRMFLAEAALAQGLAHPNVVRVEALGQDRGTHFLAMEYVRGCALSDVLVALARQASLVPPDVAVAVALHIAGALHALHEATDEHDQPLGAVHRDVSPENVLVSTAGEVKLIDFGISKLSAGGQSTYTGSLRGKLRYMAPEQAWGRRVDRRADVYALGIVLWELLAARQLFSAGDEIALLEQVRRPTIVPPSRFAPGVPPALDAAVLAALSLDPADRPATAAELGRRLSDAVPAALAVAPARLSQLVELGMAAAPTPAPTAVAAAPRVRPVRRAALVAAAAVALLAALAVPLLRSLGPRRPGFVRGLIGGPMDPSRWAAARQAGFDVVSVDPYHASLDALAARGLSGVVRLGNWSNDTCSWQRDDGWVRDRVALVARHRAIAAYLIAEGPNARRCPRAAAAVRARRDLVRALDSSAPTLALLSAYDGAAEHPYAVFAPSADIAGLRVFPCKQAGGCDFGKIDRALAEARVQGLRRIWAIVQDFGDDYYRRPTPDEMRAQLAHWQQGPLEGYLIDQAK